MNAKPWWSFVLRKRVELQIEFPRFFGKQVKEGYIHVVDQTGHETGHETGHVVRLINTIGEMTLTRPEIMTKLGLKGRGNFLANYLYPAISGGYVAMKYPEAEKRKDQAYYLTKQGKDLYRIIMVKKFPQDY